MSYLEVFLEGVGQAAAAGNAPGVGALLEAAGADREVAFAAGEVRAALEAGGPEAALAVAREGLAALSYDGA